MDVNHHIALVMGSPATGKSASLRNLVDPEGVVYLNTDRKQTPFKSKFVEVRIDDPMDIFGFLDEIAANPRIHTVILDTLTFLMDMYEVQYVVNSANTMSAWGNYATYFKQVMDKFLVMDKNIIVLAHEKKVMNESEMVLETKVPIKGSVGATGVEAFFEVVLSTKRIPIKKLEHLSKISLLEPEEDDEALGFKYVFQTKIDKNTVSERMRSPMGMWKLEEKYINNDIQLVIDRLNEYYK